MRYLILTVIALAGLSCSRSPGESDARKMLESNLRDRYGSDVQILNLQKTDGLAEEENGARYYKWWYQVEFDHTQGLQDKQHYKQAGFLRFVKTEQGWRLVEEVHDNL